MKNISIRPAEEKDYEAIMALYRESYALHTKALPDHYDLPTPTHAFKRGTFLNILDDDAEMMQLAEVEGVPVGVINASVEDVEKSNYNSAYQRISVDELCVTKLYRRHGIGQMLMAKVEEWARKKKIKEITVIVFDFNKSAIDFYKAEGYEPYSIRMLKKVDK